MRALRRLQPLRGAIVCAFLVSACDGGGSSTSGGRDAASDTGRDAGRDTGCTATLSGATTGSGSCMISGAWNTSTDETYVFGLYPMTNTEKVDIAVFLPGEIVAGTYTRATKGSITLFKTGAAWQRLPPDLAFTLAITAVDAREAPGGKQLALDGTFIVDLPPAKSAAIRGTATGTVSVQLAF